MSNNNHVAYVAMAMGLFVLGGCASEPQLSPALQEAQAAFNTAKADPNVLKHASSALDQAQGTLTRAIAAEDINDMNSLAYVANDQVQMANAISQRKMAEAKVQELGATKDTIQLEMRDAELAASKQALADLKATQTERGTVVTLSSVLFATGKADLLPGATGSVERLAKYLKDNPKKSVQIEGHTDTTGSAETNMRLSQARADSVRMALLANGVASSQVTATGLGSGRPVSSNDTAAGRQQNRRVEVIIQ